jgi:8-oxo-dGTP diphosphatase
MSTIKVHDTVEIKQRPLVGVAALIVRDGKALLGKRLSAHGSGSWALPGGHLEYGESPESCAAREVLEETGLVIKNVRFGFVTNDFFKSEKKHYITLFMRAEYYSGEATVLEPEKCEIWRWFSFDALPQPLFLTMQNLIEQCGGYENFKRALL